MHTVCMCICVLLLLFIGKLQGNEECYLHGEEQNTVKKMGIEPWTLGL